MIETPRLPSATEIQAASATKVRHDLAKEIQSNPSLSIVTYQKRPYTISIATVCRDGVLYQGVGVSKVSGNDWFRPAMGKRIATGRAVDCIARQFMNEDAEWKLEWTKAEEEPPFLVSPPRLEMEASV